MNAYLNKESSQIYSVSVSRFQGAEHTPETDIYALGVTMFEVFTRKEPFEGEDSMRVFDRMRSGAERGLRPPLPEKLPEEVKELIQQCWHTDPARRLKLPEIKYLITKLPEDKVPRLRIQKSEWFTLVLC